MARAESNGSFLVREGGAVQYIGSGGGDNQIVTFNPETESFEDTNLEDLFGGACVSQYLPDAPSKRPNDADLEIGDFWTNSETQILSIWSDELRWVYVKTINGTPVGTIIQSIIVGFLAPPPIGYLACDGTRCPPQFDELSDLLIQYNGDDNLPALAPGNFIKF